MNTPTTPDRDSPPASPVQAAHAQPAHAHAQPAPKPRRARFVPLLLWLTVGGGVGALFGYGAGRFAHELQWLSARFDALSLYDLLLLPLWFFLVVLIHELGHLAGGIGRGMRFVLLIVGPLRLRRTASGLKLDWFLRGDTFGGLAAAMPTKGAASPAQMQSLIVGGPLASLALAAVAVALAFASEGRMSAHALILALLSAAIFIATALPFRAGGLMSDGKQFLEIRRGGRAVEQRMALTAAFAESLSGVRPRDRDPAPLQRALALAGEEPLFDIGAWTMAYQVALDRRALAEAGDYIDRIAAGYDAYPNGFRQALACEIAYFSARYRHDAETAAVWYARAKGGAVEPPQRALTEAAIALARGDAALALQCVARGEACLGESSDIGGIALTADELRSLRAEAEARLAT